MTCDYGETTMTLFRVNLHSTEITGVYIIPLLMELR